MTKKIRTYSAAFKAEAVKKIADNKGNVSATAKQLAIVIQTLSNRQKKLIKAILSVLKNRILSSGPL